MNKFQSGFSTVELVIVVMIIAIMAGFALLGYTTPKKYGPDNQAMKLADMFQDARQKALTEHSAMRVEIDVTKKELHLIDENQAGDASDDIMVRRAPFDYPTEVLIGTHPKNVSSTNLPTATSPIPEPAYATSTHPLSLGDQVMVFRFLKDGQTVNAGTDSIGTNSIVTGATVYVYDNPNAAGYAKIIRAITLIGFTGASNIVKCQLDSQNNCATWVK